MKCCFWQRIRTKTRNISTTNALISINVLWLQRYKWCGQCYKRSTNKNYNWRLLLSWQICLSYKSRVVIYNCGALIAFDTDLWSIWCWGHPKFFLWPVRCKQGPVPRRSFALQCVDLWIFANFQISGQSDKASTIVIYDCRVVPNMKIPHITTLES